MQIGVDSFAAAISDPATGLTISPVQRMQNLLEEIELADQVGLDVFGIGEHHRAEFLDSAPVVILAAAATRTKNIRLTSAVTVLSAADPVRVFQEFATLDLISHGRAEIVAGRGSFVESYPLFGLSLEDYDSLFSEKLDLLLKIRENTHVHWSGKHRRRSLVKRSTLVRCKIRCRFGSGSAVLPNRSLAPVCSDFPSWSRSSVVNPNDSALLLISTVRRAAAPVTPPRNSSWVFTLSVSLETRPGRLPTTFIQDTRTHSPRSARSAAGPQLPGHSSTPCADPRVPC